MFGKMSFYEIKRRLENCSVDYELQRIKTILQCREMGHTDTCLRFDYRLIGAYSPLEKAIDKITDMSHVKELLEVFEARKPKGYFRFLED